MPTGGRHSSSCWIAGQCCLRCCPGNSRQTCLHPHLCLKLPLADMQYTHTYTHSAPACCSLIALPHALLGPLHLTQWLQAWGAQLLIASGRQTSLFVAVPWPSKWSHKSIIEGGGVARFRPRFETDGGIALPNLGLSCIALACLAWLCLWCFGWNEGPWLIHALSQFWDWRLQHWNWCKQARNRSPLLQALSVVCCHAGD